jgi:hypothetical protein
VTRIAHPDNPEPDRHLDVGGQLAPSMRGEMLLVSVNSKELSFDREAIDTEARRLVLDAYHSAKISVSDPQSQFIAALERYCKAYPHISRPVARHAVAHIIVTDEL